MVEEDKKENPVKEENRNKLIGSYGWVCPVCGRGLAPWVSQCGCVQNKTYSNSLGTNPNLGYFT